LKEHTVEIHQKLNINSLLCFFVYDVILVIVVVVMTMVMVFMSMGDDADCAGVTGSSDDDEVGVDFMCVFLPTRKESLLLLLLLLLHSQISQASRRSKRRNA